MPPAFQRSFSTQIRAQAPGCRPGTNKADETSTSPTIVPPGRRHAAERPAPGHCVSVENRAASPAFSPIAWDHVRRCGRRLARLLGAVRSRCLARSRSGACGFSRSLAAPGGTAPPPRRAPGRPPRGSSRQIDADERTHPGLSNSGKTRRCRRRSPQALQSRRCCAPMALPPSRILARRSRSVPRTVAVRARWTIRVQHRFAD